jgi:hypothetical protein
LHRSLQTKYEFTLPPFLIRSIRFYDPLLRDWWKSGALQTREKCSL